MGESPMKKLRNKYTIECGTDDGIGDNLMWEVTAGLFDSGINKVKNLVGNK